MTEPNEITGLLQRWRLGESGAEAALADAVYPLLRALARRQLSSQNAALTVQPTELAHEAYMRLFEQRAVEWKDRGHFFAITARVVRRVVIDYLRERDAQKRGGDVPRVSLDALEEQDLPSVTDEFDWLRLDRLLIELEQVDPACARVTEMRYFNGLSVVEVAAALDVSEATVARQWRMARAWLRQRLGSA